jgi:hypothetical protein
LGKRGRRDYEERGEEKRKRGKYIERVERHIYCVVEGKGRE